MGASSHSHPPGHPESSHSPVRIDVVWTRSDRMLLAAWPRWEAAGSTATTGARGYSRPHTTEGRCQLRQRWCILRQWLYFPALEHFSTNVPPLGSPWKAPLLPSLGGVSGFILFTSSSRSLGHFWQREGVECVSVSLT